MKWILNFLYVLLLTLLSPVILWRNLRHGRYRQGWKEKLLGRLPTFSSDSEVIWFHAVSVGEVLQLQHVVEHFRNAASDDVQILITTSTDSGFSLATERFAGCTVSWFPLDFSWAVSTALQRVKPDLVVLVELELWPNFLNTCASRGVRTALINARLSDRSFSGYSRIQRIVRPLFQQFAIVAAQTTEYADRLLTLGAQPTATVVTGSIKFDGAESDRRNLNTQRLRALFNIADSEVVFIAGSTQAPEEKLALDVWQQLRATHPNLRLVLVPRHRERFDEVADLVTAMNVSLLRRSQTESTSTGGSDQVILLDTIGELSACWGLADIAFVGGSFGQRGGQNMLEPAAYGAAVCFGPNTWNFKEIVSRLLQAGGAKQLQSPDEFLPTVAELSNDAELRQQYGRAAQRFVAAQPGAISRTVDLLSNSKKSESSDPIRNAA